MTESPQSLPPEPPGPSDDVLSRAAAAARAENEPGWAEVSASIQDRLRTAVRRTRLIRGEAPGGPFHVADAVLITYLRDAIDTIPGCTLLRVVLRGEGDSCTGALLEIGADYGLDLLSVAARVRDTARDLLDELLGPIVPGLGETGVDVTVIDVVEDAGGR